ncbi:uncharacterized protein LTR77_009878 [Saxophila tyrrhenica]|uniref:Clr5 domain-containing protein n=1 Tax=Saxophila tyrrhenica TaxID=1690608 RepID=A0AAV9P089_9PEZI|nr:hypothetical protein LTR77_009878 [Saxophila tyrrhenica]
MARRVPSKEDWERLRPQVTEWYRTKTAETIVRLLRQDGYLVSQKMLRDRFKAWRVERKYTNNGQTQRRQVLSRRHGLLSNEQTSLASRSRYPPEDSSRNVLGVQFGADALMKPVPSRAPNTPEEEYHLSHALSQISGYLDRLVEQGSWRNRNETPAFEIQKLAADTHLAISSQSAGSSQSFNDLRSLGESTFILMPKFNADGLLTLHPRALTALLRLVVDGTSIPNAMALWEARTLQTVKNMFRDAAKAALPATHPIPLLCGVRAGQSQDLLARQFELMDVRLYARISHVDKVFVAQEQIYGSRVLASLGYVQWAETKLSAVIADLSSYSCQYTYAEANRTLGYVLQQACARLRPEQVDSKLEEAEGSASLALGAFVGIGMGQSNEAVYTRICLADILRQRNNLRASERHLRDAVDICETRAEGEGQQRVQLSKLVSDLHDVLRREDKRAEVRALELKYSEHFPESQADTNESCAGS